MISPQKTNMTMENQPFEDVFPIEHGDFPSRHVSFLGCNIYEPSLLSLCTAVITCFQVSSCKLVLQGDKKRIHQGYTVDGKCPAFTS